MAGSAPSTSNGPEPGSLSGKDCDSDTTGLHSRESKETRSPSVGGRSSTQYETRHPLARPGFASAGLHAESVDKGTFATPTWTVSTM